jgi:hypothetical protein
MYDEERRKECKSKALAEEFSIDTCLVFFD